MAKNFSIELSLKRLEEIAELLESGDTSLSDSLKLFEEGTALIHKCRQTLETAEQKIVDLSKIKDGTEE